ncbi:TPA: hypothetical protein EYG96_00195 [Candidatus Gracilibacteria bacterium]|nr:hypothetical protein [Candidatus Peregrinibacteria bacterium]HIQ56448.1 hypothetical protein [Candidatus Gracilibacteria bacterium]
MNNIKSTIIGGGIIISIIGGIWFVLSFFGENSIENIAKNITKITPAATQNQEFINSLTMNNGEEIFDDVFIGDDESEEVVIKKDTYLEFAKKFEIAVEKKDFSAICAMTSQCNVKSTDVQKLAIKEKQYASHRVTYFRSLKDDTVLCYTESIRLKNDNNKNSIIYTYHVGVKKGEKDGEFEFQKPRCEKVSKLPYGDITDRSPYDKKCGAGVTRILCEKI